MAFRIPLAHLMCAITLIVSPIASAAPTSQPTTQPEKEKLGEQIQKVERRAEKLQSDPENQLDRARKSGKPAPDPKTAPLASATPATSPTTSPTTNPTAQVKFPTPAELYEKMQKAKAEKASQLKIAYFDLNDAISEKPSEFSIFNPEGSLTLHTLIDRINKARDDKDVRAVLITLGDASMGLAQAAEVRDALKDVSRSNKRVFVYADSYDTVAYTIAIGASDICLLQGGEIMIPGVGFETMFYKGTMDKVGVKADYIQIGEYKGAEEPYTRTEPSEELRGELTKLADAVYDQLVDGISMARGVSRQAVQQLVDDTMLSAAGAKDRGFVDHIVDQDGLRELIKDELGGDIDLLADYGAAKREEIDWSNPFLVLASLAKRPEPTNRPAIALIYAAGVIEDGGGRSGLLSGSSGVGSDPMRRAFRTAMRDENIKAIVLRIDSPGGKRVGERSDVAGGPTRGGEEAAHRQRRWHGRQRGLLPRVRRRLHLRRPKRHRRLDRRGGRQVRDQRSVRESRPEHRIVQQGSERRPVQHERAVERSAAADGARLDAADVRPVHAAHPHHAQREDRGHRQGRARENLPGATSERARHDRRAWRNASGHRLRREKGESRSGLIRSAHRARPAHVCRFL